MSSQGQKHFAFRQLSNVWNRLQLSVYRQKNPPSASTQSDNNQNMLFLIFGLTTSGKTVVQYYLCEDELQFLQEQKKKVRDLLPVKQYREAQVIKEASSITTRYPNIRAHNEPSEANELSQKQVVFVQIPDMKQLQAEQKTCLHFFITKVLKQFNNIHMLIVITQQALDDGASLIENFQCLTQLFDTTESVVQQKLSQNLSIIINKTDPKNDQADVKEKLQDLNNDIIQEENEGLFNVIDTVIRNERVYIIKEEQPGEVEQREMFEKIVDNGECGQFREVKVKAEEIQELIPEDDGVEDMMERVDLVNRWLESCMHLFTLSKYLSDSKNRQQNLNALQPIITSKINQLSTVLTEEQRLNPKQIRFQGKLPSSIKSTLCNLIKPLSSPTQPPFSIKTLIQLLQQLKQACLQQLGIYLNEQAKQQSSFVNDESVICQPTGVENDGEIKNGVFYELVVGVCNQLCIGVEYLRRVLDFRQGSNEEENGEQEGEYEFRNETIAKQVQLLVEQFKEQFSQFNLNWLIKSKTPKSPLKKSPHKKPQQIITVTYTIEHLKQHIYANNKPKPYEALLNTIFALPNTHFKLYMLCLQLPTDLEKFAEEKFMHFLEIVREISEVLRVGEMFVDQLMFLVLLPDWNRIQVGVESVEKKQARIVKEQKREHIEFLNKLGVYAKQARRDKLSQRVFTLVDSLIEQITQNNPAFNAQQILSFRQQSPQIQQKLFHIQALQLYGQNIEGLPRVVELFKEQQAKLQSEISRKNQFGYFITHDNL